MKKYMFALFLVCLAIPAFAFDLNKGIGAAATAGKALSISEEDLNAESRRSVEEMDKANTVAPPSHRYAKHLKTLTHKYTKWDGLDLNFKVYLTKDMNAFATPDGSIRVFSELLNTLEADELLAVIGHEIGHVKLKHSLAQYRSAYLTKAAKEGLAAAGGKVGSLANSQYAAIGEQFLNAQFSQSDELEADRYGIHFLKKIGQDPEAMVRLHEKFKKMAGSDSSIMSSHPSFDSRIQKAKEEVAKIKRK